jgi:TonB family protein
MENFIYIGKVSAGLLAFYALYWVSLRWHTYFHFNRFYLLTATVLSLVVPLITITETLPEPVTLPVATLPVEALNVVYQPAPPQPLLTPVQIWGVVYLLGVWMLIRLGRRIAQILRLIRASAQVSVEDFTLVQMDNTRLSSFSFLRYLVVNPQDIPSLTQYHESPVIAHELVHIRQRHSWDLLWLELLQAFLWFNPVLILYKRSLKQIHEFIADDLATHGDRLAYARALAGYALGVSPQVLTNNFFDISHRNDEPLKLRIAMLTKNRSSRRVLGRYLLALPVLGLMVALLAARQIVYEPNPKEEIVVTGKVTAQDGTGIPGVKVLLINSENGTNTDSQGNYKIRAKINDRLWFSFIGFSTVVVIVKDTKPINVTLQLKPGTTISTVYADGNTPKVEEVLDTALIKAMEGTISLPEFKITGSPTKPLSDDVVFLNVEQMPMFPNGFGGLEAYLAQNIKYPAAAQRANVQGIVYVRFVVNKDGSIRNPKILKEIGFGFDEEALRIVLNMPAWIPGKQNGKAVPVELTLPVKFVLRKPIDIRIGTDTQQMTLESDTKIILENWNRPQPLYFLDGKELENASLKDVFPEDIENIHVVKGEKATAIYGERGKNGVVLIKTKNAEMRRRIEEGKILASQNGVSDDDSVYNVVEQSPNYKGGMKAFYEYLKANMVYPEAAKEKKIEGKVFLTFVVRKDGTLADIQILKGLGYGCDAESVKLLAKSGTWKPAMHKGKVVNCRFNVPVPFELNPK